MNSTPTVKIKITGAAGSGKTTIMNILAWALKKHGIRFECEDEAGRPGGGMKVVRFTKPVKREYCQRRLVKITCKEKTLKG